MQVITAEKGKRFGKIAITDTLLTMQKDEIWCVQLDESISIYTLRSAASRLWFTHHFRFSIIATGSHTLNVIRIR